MPTAITRGVSPRFADCELTHLERQPIDVAVASAQHEGYVRALRQAGCEIVELPPERDLPDSVFIEDTAVILPEVAIITRPGADSRKPETEGVARVLSSYRELAAIRAPATLDGGDVLLLDKEVYVGLSTRSSLQAIEQLRSVLGQFGYTVFDVQLTGCLHLKSAVTSIGSGRLLINREWADARAFENHELFDISVAEPFAANILMIGGTGIYPAGFPETADMLVKRGVKLLTVDVSELAKAEGAVTCCSLILP